MTRWTTALARPGAELWQVGQSARDRWIAGGRPILAVVFAMGSVLAAAAYGTPRWHLVAITVGGVRATLPWSTELARLPASAFLPTAELPLPFAVAQIVVVLGLAELLLGRLATAAVAMSGHLAATLTARLLIALSLTGFGLIGLPASQARLLDTGPSAMTTAVGAWLLIRFRAYWCAALLTAGLLAADLLQNNLDGREHLAALACGLGAAVLLPAVRSLALAVRARLARLAGRDNWLVRSRALPQHGPQGRH